MSKVALVTGGDGGIGTAICQRLAQAGFQIAITYIIDLERVQAWASKLDFPVKYYHCDVSSYESCQALKENMAADGIQPDVIVNNAGITRDAKFVRMTPDMWRAVMSTNLDSMFNVCHQFVPGMIERGFGRIINISSVNGQKGQAGQCNYSAAKAGVHGFTMALAQEVVRNGITVNSISPGYIGTEMVMAIREDVREKIVDSIPMKRLGKPSEIGALATFLASDDAAFITGANFSANGGQFMN